MEPSHRACIGLEGKCLHTPLFSAAKVGNASAVKTLLERRAEVDFKVLNKVTALGIATVNNHPGVMRVLIKYGSDVNQPHYHGQIPLDVAFRNQNKAAIEVRIENGAKVENPKAPAIP